MPNAHSPSDAIVIRDAIPADAATIVEYQLAMALETENLQLARDVVTAGVAAVFADPRKGSYYVAERGGYLGGELVGVLLTIPEWSDWRNGTVLWLHSVYVRPDTRRWGIFRRLYAHVRQIVELSPDLRGLRLYVDRSNGVAQTVYRELGMRDDHYAMFEWMK